MAGGGLPTPFEVAKIARKALSWDEADPRDIPSYYLEALMEHLKAYPNETDFLVELANDDSGNTAVTCLHCYDEYLVGIGRAPFSFRPFWDHIESQQHKFAVSAATQEAEMHGTREDPMDVDLLDWNVAYDLPPPENPASHRRRITRHVLLSDGETIEYSTDEELPQLNHLQQQNTTPVTQNFASSSSHYPRILPREPSPASNNFACPQKRPHRGFRKYEFGDGEVFYLSTDDETVDERPQPRLEKHPRLGGALIKSQSSIVPLVKSGQTLQYPQRPHPPVQQQQEATPVISGWSSLSGWDDVSQAKQWTQQNISYYGQGQIPPSPLRDYHHYQSSWANPSTSKPVYGRNYHVASTSSHLRMPQQNFQNNIRSSMSYQSTSDYRHPVQPSVVPSQAHSSHLDLHSNGHQLGYDMPGAFPPNMDYHAPQAPQTIALPVLPGQLIPNGLPAGPQPNQEPEPAFDNTQKFKDFFLTAMEDFQEAPKVMDAARKLDLENTSSFLPGLEVQLMPHQLIGVSWMLEQERKATKGGILADDMGLGKTLQCIATCVKNRPEPDAEIRSTLVVAPAALLQQWKTEILQRTNEGLFEVHIHHGKEKLRTVADVKKFDFVITTYQTLCLEYPKRKKLGPDGELLEALSSDDSDEEDDGQRPIRGPLAQTEWYRVVLDEAQFVRNRKTRSSKCVARLKSTYRWTLTGTPVVNSLEDLYSPMRFLRMHPFDEWREFKHRILSVQKNPKLAGDRAQAMLKKCLMRRTKETKLEGKPILQLPTKEIEIINIDFSPDERLIYDKIERREQLRMTKFLKAGTVLKNYMVILVMLLRLRQACNHPLLIASEEEEDPLGFNTVLEDADAPNKDKNKNASKDDVERAERIMGPAFVEEVKAKLLTQAEERLKAEAKGLSLEEEDTECPICYDSYITNCCITKCKHMFCSDCLNDLFTNPPSGVQAQDAEYNRALQSGIRPCPVCRNNLHPDEIFRTKFFEPTELQLNVLRESHASLPSSNGVASVDVKGKGKATDDDAGLDDIMGDLGNEKFEPSAKMVKMIDLLKQWNQEAPDDKIICYSQWTSMLDLIERLLDKHDIDTVRYDGKMSRTERDAAVMEFKKRSGPPIMLISLKCGGVGLNLVEANRVVCLDLAWNAATENQAFDRVHRMGQQKDVHVKRLIVRNTVEDRILKLQASKQALSDAALGEGKAGKLKKLSVVELKALFGLAS